MRMLRMFCLAGLVLTSSVCAFATTYKGEYYYEAYVTVSNPNQTVLYGTFQNCTIAPQAEVDTNTYGIQGVSIGNGVYNRHYDVLRSHCK